ncbi:MAG: alpha-ketoglutarate-dependent dioxygenase AlkB [Microthrixaceae bacterium]|nr:alpha-ketoglutarate-dependent dioxygenase AlkB [Microthrixaceae bacterium]MCO5313189.1 alpha-ketoglutarate-dependent dioxygenase AlkB [Microthrixaceae bacterium]HPB44879.1 alpha-ketoglutarate-dependent dioxygenase AlkB [Microthrixaceae bacterium]
MTNRAPLTIDRHAVVERLWLDETSWVDVVRRFVREPATLTASLLDDVVWRPDEQFRYEVTITSPRLIATPRGESLPAAVRQIELHLAATYRRRFSGPALIQYRTGRDSVAFHRDREMRWLDDTLIAIVSLGATRPFAFRPVHSRRDDDTHDHRIDLNSGDLIVMGGRAQQDWLHAVPKCDASEPRVSMTWRWTSRGGRPDSSAPYRGARHFGDSGRVGPQRRN